MSRLTETDLAAIEAREQQASPGPWYPWHRCIGVKETPDTNEEAGLGWEIVVNRDTGARAWPRPSLRGTFERGQDAYFVANARQDVPALLAEVRRLRQELAFAVRMAERPEPPTLAGDPAASDGYWRHIVEGIAALAEEALKDQ